MLDKDALAPAAADITARIKALYSPKCVLCEVRCGVDRAAGQLGACGLADTTPVYRRLVHLGEERELVPSYAVWLTGCNFSCTFCSDSHALRPPLPGLVYSATALAEIIADDIEKSQYLIKNINFVGGDPSISLPYLADVSDALHSRIGSQCPPLLLNTNGFLTPEALAIALDLFEIFVLDFKFGNDKCAHDVAHVRNYTDILMRNLDVLAHSGKNVWVRHLLMPDHIDCCTRPVLTALEQFRDTPIKVNLMPAFVSFSKSWRPIQKEERSQGRRLFDAAQINNRYWDGKAVYKAG